MNSLIAKVKNPSSSSLSGLPLLGSAIFLAFLLSSLVFFLMETFIFPGVVLKYFGINILVLATITLILLLAMRLFLKLNFRDGIKQILHYSSAFGLFLTMVLRICNIYIFPTFSLTLLHIHTDGLLQLSYFLFLLFSFSLSKSYIIKNKNVFIGSLAVFALSLMYQFSINFESAFWHLEKEDSVTEWLTVFVYLGCSYLSYQIYALFKNISKTNKNDLTAKLISWIFLIAMIAFLFIAGEEISWGQRIIGFSTPEEIAQNNTQFEFNVHNNKTVFRYVYLAYGGLALYCSVAWIVFEVLKRFSKAKSLEKLEVFVPPKHLLMFFPPMIFYVYIRKTMGDVILDRWEEFVEFLLAVGILLYLKHRLSQFSRSRNRSDSDQN